MILQKPLTVPFKTKGNVIGRIKTMQLCYKYTWSRLGKRNINRIKVLKICDEKVYRFSNSSIGGEFDSILYYLLKGNLRPKMMGATITMSIVECWVFEFNLLLVENSYLDRWQTRLCGRHLCGS